MTQTQRRVQRFVIPKSPGTRNLPVHCPQLVWPQIAGCLAPQLVGELFFWLPYHFSLFSLPAPCRGLTPRNAHIQREWLALPAGPAYLAPKGLRHGPMPPSRQSGSSPERPAGRPREQRRTGFSVGFGLMALASRRPSGCRRKDRHARAHVLTSRSGPHSWDYSVAAVVEN